MREDTNSNDLQEIITQAIEEIKNEQGDNFDQRAHALFFIANAWLKRGT